MICSLSLWLSLLGLGRLSSRWYSFVMPVIVLLASLTRSLHRSCSLLERCSCFDGSVHVLGARSSGGEFEDGVTRKRIRHTKKTNVRKRFGFDLWGQPKGGRPLHCG